MYRSVVSGRWVTEVFLYPFWHRDVRHSWLTFHRAYQQLVTENGQRRVRDFRIRRAVRDDATLSATDLRELGMYV